MPVDTAGHAQLMGYCAGTLAEPDGAGRCPTCRHDAGLTPGGYVGHHIEEPGPRSIYVDPDDSLTTVDAINTPTPGLLLARPHGSEEDRWQVFHAGTGLVLHPSRYFYPVSLATALVCQLEALGDWLADAETIRGDSQLALASQLVCFMAYQTLDTDQEGGGNGTGGGKEET